MAACGFNFQSTPSLSLTIHKTHLFFGGKGRETFTESLQLDFTEASWIQSLALNCAFYQWQNLYFNF